MRYLHLRPSAVLLCVTLGLALPSQRLVVDLHVAGPGSPELRYGSGAHGYVQIGARLWFLAWDRTLGEQPFVYDRDGARIVPGLGRSEARAIANLDDRRAILFGDAGVWVSDGTLDGTIQLAAVRFEADYGPHRFRGRIGDRLLFHGFTSQHGWETWITDGSPQGTGLLRESLPGPEPQQPGMFVFGEWNGRLWFAGLDARHGYELWSTDGTPAGTSLVCDLNPGPNGSVSRQQPYFVPAGKRAFFAAHVDGLGTEPCVTDGTANGTFVLADVLAGSGSGVAWNDGPRRTPPVLAAGKLVFAARSFSGGLELWTSNGTRTGTVQALDLVPGPVGSDPTWLHRIGRAVVFAASPGPSGQVLLAIDVPNGRVATLWQPGPNKQLAWLPTVLSAGRPERLLFGVRTHTDDLWVTDGTPAGTRVLRLASTPPRRSRMVGDVHEIRGRLCFFQDEGVGLGLEPWVSDGTPEGTKLLRDIFPGPIDSVNPNQPSIAVYRDRIVFTGASPEHGYEPWISDGTPEGTRLLADVGPSRQPDSDPKLAGTLRDRAFLSAKVDPYRYGAWVTDGTPAGTGPLFDGSAGQPKSWSAAESGLEVADRFVFMAEDEHGGELWVSDGRPGDARLLADLRPGPAGSMPQLLRVIGRMLFLAADDGVHGRELWATDGTPDGTRLVVDLLPGPGSAVPGAWIEVATLRQRELLFFATDGRTGFEPWITDGTAAGTRLVRDVYAGGGSSVDPTRLTTTQIGDDFALFLASDRGSGFIPWATDGTSAGTYALSEGFAGSSYFYFVSPIRGSDHTLVQEMIPYGFPNLRTWLTDGTIAGTFVLIPDWWAHPYAMLRGRLLFGHSGAYWTTDGTPNGARRLFPRPGDGIQLRSGQALSGELFFFRAEDADHGNELWATDGTEAGTRLVADLEPGPFGTGHDDPWIVPLGDHEHVLLSAHDRAHGEETWVSDGTADGTRIVGDLRAGPYCSNPLPLARIGGQYLISADSDRYGREPFAVDLRDHGVGLVARVGEGCAGSGGLVPALAATGRPVAGSRDLAALLIRGRPLAPATLLLGSGPDPWFAGGGCSLYVQPLDLRSAITDPNGRAPFALPIPADPVLVGLRFHAQSLVLDPAGSWRGLLAFSNALECIVGR